MTHPSTPQDRTAFRSALRETPLSVSRLRHPQGCAFCPAELLGLERDANGDPLCQTCPHLTPGEMMTP